MSDYSSTFTETDGVDDVNAADFTVEFNAIQTAIATKQEYGTSITSDTAAASTSGTAIDFASIPSGTKRIVIMFNQVSVSGTDSIGVQVGDSGGIEATGYVSFVRDLIAPTNNTNTTRFQVTASFTASYTYSGNIELTLLDSATNTWTCTSTLSYPVVSMNIQSGRKALTATLDRVRILTSGTDTFDNGAVNIIYHG